MSNYWAKRTAKEQEAISDKTIKETNDQLKKYYKNSMRKVISEFIEVYEKLLLSLEEGEVPAPARLYSLGKYYEMQNQLQKELQKLGDKESVLLSKKFMQEYQAIYESIALKGERIFNEANIEIANQVINSIWCADGKNWSARVWQNTEDLAETLNEELIHCVVSGKKTTELKHLLQERFGVAYHRTDSLVRTEIAHIQTESAKQRYKDYGIKEVEVLVSPDERTCPICGELEGKRFPIHGKMPVPAHPRCRCCIIPVLED